MVLAANPTDAAAASSVELTGWYIGFCISVVSKLRLRDHDGPVPSSGQVHMRIVRRSELVEMPWKKGGGITRDVALEMLEGTLLWRLSMADAGVDGPFSSFAGLTRILTVVQGDGMILRGPDGELRADYAQPVVFDGNAPIQAELTQGPLRDFNLIYDTERCKADANVIHGPADATYDEQGMTFVVHCIAGTARLDAAHRLDAGDTSALVCR